MEFVNKTINLSIIILSYKSKEHLKVLLPSIWESKEVDFSIADPPMNRHATYRGEVIIVDNGSNDGTADWVREQLKNLKFKDLKIIENNNTGYAAGNNLGIRQARGEYILLLNPDTKLNPDTLEIMLNFVNTHPEIGISGCKLVKADGKLDLACRRRFPNPANSFKRLFLENNKDYNYSNISEDQEIEVDSVVGAFMLIRKSVVDKIGMLDESFFMYAEDLDYCWRCKETGFKVWYYPKAVATHYKGESSKKAPFVMLKAFHDSMWIFYKKYYSQKYPAIFNWLVWVGINLRFCFLLLINLFKKNPYVSK